MREMPKFIPGLRLSERYYREVVAGILRRNFPNLRYSAGLVGTGSEVLGYDTPRSRDHNWGPRLFIFLSKEDIAAEKPKIDRVLKNELPLSFLGYPTSFGKPDKIGVRLLDRVKNRIGPVSHFIVFQTIEGFLKWQLGIDHYNHVNAVTWLSLPQQKLLEVASSSIFHDDLRVEAVIDRFRYYPRDVWLYKMAERWKNISEEEALVGRTSEVGDDLGSKLIAARIVQELTLLCFLMEKKYTPYSKWLGSAFSNLDIAAKLKPVLNQVLESKSFADREANLSRAYQIVADRHNQLHITVKMPTVTSRFYGRPYMVIHADRFAAELMKQIKDKKIRSMPLGDV